MKSTAGVTTIAIDFAKDVFQLALADSSWHTVRGLRLKRAEFLAFWANHAVVHVVMEACGSAHHFGRWLRAMGHRVTLLPAQYVRPYVRCNKTDKADCAALLEALRASDIKPVPIKTEHQQVIQLMHRSRQQWQHDRTARINLARGILREFGVVVPGGAERGLKVMSMQLANGQLDPNIRKLLRTILDEIDGFEQRVIQPTPGTLSSFSSTGSDSLSAASARSNWVTATALRASVGDIHRFKDGRTLSSWIGFTPKETSSGSSRILGGMSKRGDVYLRTLLIQGARSVLAAARRKQQSGKPLDALRQWALDLADRRGFNKAAVGLANKLARIIWATWKHDREFNGDHNLKHATTTA